MPCKPAKPAKPPVARKPPSPKPAAPRNEAGSSRSGSPSRRSSQHRLGFGQISDVSRAYIKINMHQQGSQDSFEARICQEVSLDSYIVILHPVLLPNPIPVTSVQALLEKLRNLLQICIH